MKRRIAEAIEPTVDIKTLSVSRINSYVTCHRYYYWRYVRNLVQREMYMPFFVGDVVHRGMANFYGGKMEPSEVIERAYADIAEITGRAFIRPEEMGKLEVQKAMCLGILRGYMEKYTDDLSKWKIVKAEQPFSVKLTGLSRDLDFVGVIDLIYEENKRLCVAEHKTASDITKGYIDRLPFDLQAQCYPLFVQRCLKRVLHQVCYNVVKKTQIRLKKNERFDQFVDRITSEYTEKPSDYFYREPLLYNQRFVDEAFNDILMVAEEILMYYDCLTEEQLLDPKSWYRNSRACFANHSVCPYYKPCRFGDRSDILTLFTKREEMSRGEVINEETIPGKIPVPKPRKPKSS